MGKRALWILIYVLVIVNSIPVQYKAYKPLVFGWIPFWLLWSFIFAVLFNVVFFYTVLFKEADYKVEAGEKK